MNFINKYYSRKNFYCRGGYFEVWKIAYPLIILGASYIVLMITDRLLLAWNNPLEMSAAVPAGSLNFTLFSFYTVTIGFTSAIVAQYYGAKNYRNCVKSAWNAVYFSIFAVLIILVVNIPLGRYIILNSGHAPELAALELKFFYAIQGNSCCACLSGGLFGFFSGTGRTKMVAKVNGCMCLLNIVLDYCMIYGVSFLKIPAMGIIGAGVATSLCSFFSCVWVFKEFLCEDQKLYPTRKYIHFNLKRIKKLVNFGAPAGLQVLIGSGGFSCFQFVVGNIGVDAMAASSILLTLNTLSYAPIVGFSDATGILVAQYIGRNRIDIAERVVYAVWRMLLIYVIILGAIYVIFPELLVKAFIVGGKSQSQAEMINFNTVLSYTRIMLLIAVFVNVLEALRFVVVGALRGAGDTKILLVYVASCSLGIFVPGSIILSRVFNFGIIGLWVFFFCYLVVLTCIMVRRFKSGIWKNIKMIKR